MYYSGGKEVGTRDARVYREALLEFGNCEGFKHCLAKEDLQRITEKFLTCRCKQEYTISFKHCKTGCMYFQLLEESLAFDDQDLSNSIQTIIKCLYEILIDESLDAMKNDLLTFHTELVDNGLLDNSTFNMCYADGPMEPLVKPKFYQESPVDSRIPRLVLDNEECYPINKTGKRGVCVIVNEYRIHSCEDVLPIRRLFEDLNYEVIPFDNVKREEFISSVTGSSYDSVHRRISDLKSDSFILILSSHGDEENVIFLDGKLTRESIIQYFLNDYCPALIGKPKLFFFQNCRGNEGMMDDLTNLEGLMSDAQLNHLRTRETPPVSNHQSDIVRFYASTQGAKSFRNDNGTFFLQCLIEILEDPKKKRRSFNDIQPELCRKVCEKAQIQLKENNLIGCQTPQCVTTLFRQYYFCHPHL